MIQEKMNTCIESLYLLPWLVFNDRDSQCPPMFWWQSFKTESVGGVKAPKPGWGSPSQPRSTYTICFWGHGFAEVAHPGLTRGWQSETKTFHVLFFCPSSGQCPWPHPALSCLTVQRSSPGYLGDDCLPRCIGIRQKVGHRKEWYDERAKPCG